MRPDLLNLHYRFFSLFGQMDLRRPSGVVAAPPLTGLLPKAPVRQHPGAAPEWRPAALPAALAFLTVHGVSPVVLLTAAADARRQAITPEAALLASGTIGDSFYYRCLKRNSPNRLRLRSAFLLHYQQHAAPQGKRRTSSRTATRREILAPIVSGINRGPAPEANFLGVS